MGEINIHLQILKDRKPLLISWLNSNNNVVEGCLVTCPCQGFELEHVSRKDEFFPVQIGRAMEVANIVSFAEGMNITSLKKKYEEEVVRKEGQEKTKRKKKKGSGKNTVVVQGKEKVEVIDVKEEDIEMEEREETLDELQRGQKEQQGETAQPDNSGKLDENEDDNCYGDNLGHSDDLKPELKFGSKGDIRSDGHSLKPEVILKSEGEQWKEDDNNVVGDLKQNRNIDSDDESETGLLVNNEDHSEENNQIDSHMASDGEEHCMEPSEGKRVSDKVLDKRDDGSLVKDRDIMEQISDMFCVTDEQNVANTVEVSIDGHSEGMDDISKGLAINEAMVTSDIALPVVNTLSDSSLGLPATTTVTLTDAEGNTYVNMSGVEVIQTPTNQAHGGRYITLLSDAHNGPWSTEQEQVLLKTLEGFFNANSSGPGGIQEPLQGVTDAQASFSDIDVYTMKIIQGEVQGPLKKTDQTRMDKYLAFKKHKDDEFNRKYHKYQKIKGVNFILCELCGAPLTNKNRKMHMSSMHQAPEERERNSVCDICGKSFLSHNNLKRHLDTHTGIRYKCKFCGKSYSQDHSRKLHEKEHYGDFRRTLRNPFAGIEDKEPSTKQSNPRPYAFINCEVCSKQLRPTSLNGHMKTHKNEYYTCEICNKVLRMSGKREHMMRHTGVKNFKCNLCSKKFSSKGSLEAHTRVHTQERPYKCRYCVESFKTSHTRNTHQRIHTGEKPYRCDKCNKSWRDRTTYWGHMKKHHPGEPLMYVRKSLQIQAARDAMQVQQDSLAHLAEQAIDAGGAAGNIITLTIPVAESVTV